MIAWSCVYQPTDWPRPDENPSERLKTADFSRRADAEQHAKARPYGDGIYSVCPTIPPDADHEMFAEPYRV